ncbi:MAG: response regulator [Kiritimatiellaeota bacterium]|nr:response regulator [Kiritimatiellota bacterium]
MAAESAREAVLIIDDELGPRESLRILLKNDYQVLCADNVDTGLQLLRAHQPSVIVMDIRMPKKNGIQGLSEIRKLDPLVSVIMLTGYGALETAQEAIRHGANDYLSKPFDAREIQEIVKRHAQRTRVERRRRHSEEELRQINEQLSANLASKERLAAIGQKSAEFVHDLRNPLTAVLGYVELLSEDLKQSKDKLAERWTDTAEYLEIIERNVTRCRELSEMWLSLGKKTSGQMRPVVVQELLQEVMESVGPMADSLGVHVEWARDQEPGAIEADRLQVFRALCNLVINAVEAVASGTGVVRIRNGKADGRVKISIQDNGSGIVPEQLKRLFEPYFTTKGKTGTGLGLFITKKVIEEHCGTIEVQSKANEGTVFTVSLPLARP